MTMIATCGHDISDYPWDWPAVWTKGWHSGYGEWSYSVLCFPCIMEVQRAAGCAVQFTNPFEGWSTVLSTPSEKEQAILHLMEVGEWNRQEAEEVYEGIREGLRSRKGDRTLSLEELRAELEEEQER